MSVFAKHCVAASVFCSMMVGAGNFDTVMRSAYRHGANNVCPMTNSSALRHLKFVLSDSSFSEFVTQAGIYGVNPDSIDLVSDLHVCTSLDSTLNVFSLDADTSYYNYENYNRVYFEDDSLYYSVEWVKMDTSSVAQGEFFGMIQTGPDYYTVFDRNYDIIARISM